MRLSSAPPYDVACDPPEPSPPDITDVELNVGCLRSALHRPTSGDATGAPLVVTGTLREHAPSVSEATLATTTSVEIGRRRDMVKPPGGRGAWKGGCGAKLRAAPRL